MKLFNTLSRKIEEVKPVEPGKIRLYTCGQTVYDYTHIGHLKRYIGDDILRRVLTASSLQVQHVQNVTDVGHLVSDADEGDDKLEKGAKEKGQTVWEIARFFEDYHYKSLDQLNVLRPNIVARATEHINEMVKLIQKLEEKGFTYQTDEAIYFDTSKFGNYGQLSGQKLAEKETGVREEVVVDPNKKHPQDFALWFLIVGRFKDHTMRWSSPWGEGFPGWHIECSAMSMLYLGNTLDIHTGGIDHIPIHHENEIAQSEAATGVKFVNIWVHHNFLQVEGEKMSKSKKNFYTIDDIKNKGFDPLALRYLILTSHYKDQLNFTWRSLEASQNALNNLRDEVRSWDQPKIGCAEYEQKFMEAVNNDLNTPQALAVMWEMVKPARNALARNASHIDASGSDYPTSAKAGSLLKMDKILGLDLEKYVARPKEIPGEVMKLVGQREKARANKDFKKSDELRKEIKKLGFEILDTTDGPKIK